MTGHIRVIKALWMVYTLIDLVWFSCIIL